MKHIDKGFNMKVLLTVVVIVLLGIVAYSFLRSVKNPLHPQINNSSAQTDTSLKILSPKLGDSWKIGETYSVEFQNIPKGSFIQGWLQNKNEASTGTASIGVIEVGRDGNPSSNIQITVPSQWCGGECGAVQYVVPGQYRLLLNVHPNVGDSSSQTFYSDYFTITN